MKKSRCCEGGDLDAGCYHDHCKGPIPIPPNGKPRNNGQWTEARFKSFIISALRSATTRWGPKQQCIKDARVSRGLYKCEGCGTVGPPTLPPPEGKTRRIKNIVADHIDPIVDPHIGFTSYDSWIDRCFVEASGFQALCNKCHTEKSNKEKEIAKNRKLNDAS